MIAWLGYQSQGIDSMTNPAERIEDALNELCQYNDRTDGGQAGNMYLGKDIFVAEIRHPKIIEGECTEGDERYDLVESIDEYRKQDIGTQQEKRLSGKW